MELVAAFVERSDELQAVLDAFEQGHSRGVLLSAPIGTGKSRLATEALSELQAGGHPTLSIRASVVSHRIPLGALSGALDLGTTDPAPTPTAVELAERCVAKLIEMAGRRRLVLLVDDAHLLDDMSLLVVERLAASEHAFLILTARTGEGEFETLAEMGARGHFQVIPLGPFTRDEVAVLIERSLGGAADAGLVSKLFEHSEGNPLCVLELLRGTLESDQLSNHGGLWRLTGPLNASQRVREIVESRLRGLGTAELALLEFLAFVDRLDRPAVEHFATLDTLLALEARGLVTSTLQQRQLSATLAHPLYGDVIRANMSGLKTQVATEALADYLEDQPDLSDSQCLQLAALRLICGGDSGSLMMRAAEVALQRHDLNLALECAHAAVEADGTIAPRLLRARALSLRGEFEEADRELTGCLDLASTDEQLVEAAVLRLDFLTFYQGQVADALAFASEVEARISDRALAQKLTVRRAGALLHTEGPRAVAQAVAPILEAGSTDVESWACMLAAWAYLRLGKFNDAISVSLRGEAAQSAHNDATDWYPELHSVVRCYAEAGAGMFEHSRTRARAQLDVAVAGQATEAIGGYALFLASLVRDLGHTDQAIRHADIAVAAYRDLGRGVYLADAKVHRGLALALAGRAEEALADLETVEAMDFADYWYFSPELFQARGWSHAAQGRRQEARADFIESAAISARSGDLTGAMTAWHACARIGFPRPALEPMKRIAKQTDSALVATRLLHVAGLANNSADALQQASETFEALDAHLLAGEAAASAAKVLKHHGSTRAAEAWMRRATALLRLQNGPINPVLRHRPAADLTASEADTARLAAQGLSNAEIAQMLSLSIRTVENRLQRVYVKLGVNGRRELANLGS